MILITGATGHFGKAAIELLLAKGIPANSISAMVRDSSKAVELQAKGINIRIGDYDNYNSLVSAFTGIDELLLVSSNNIPNRLAQHTNAVNAAKQAGVKHIVYTSFVRRNETETNPLGLLATAHIETDKLIKASGMAYTIMLNNLYAEALTMFLGENVLETGIFLPAGNGKVAYTARQDMAEAAAIILTNPQHQNKEYIISTDMNYTLDEVATMLSELSDKSIANVNPSMDVFKDSMAKNGVPAEIITMMAVFSKAIEEGEFETYSKDLEMILGRKPATIKEFLKSIYVK